MTRLEILNYQLSKGLSAEDLSKITENDKSFVLNKATQIVDDYVHYRSGSELNYVICDIAYDMLFDDLIKSINTKPMDVPSNIASIKEGDTIITFNQDGSQSATASKTGLTGNEYYINTYRDELNRFRKLKR